MYYNTVVWEKFVVENIHVKIIFVKNFRCCWHPMKKFLQLNLTIEFFQVSVSVGQEAITH